jgi:hypothetical protein
VNGFLVVGRCGCDDIPLTLWAERAKADEYAAAIKPEGVMQRAKRVMTVDTQNVCGVGIVEFKNGVAQEIEMVRDFETEEDKA